MAYGLAKAQTPVFLAQVDGEIAGFACYDVAHEKKGVFGPMGTASGRRGEGIGKLLLLNCLWDMQLHGYDYAIIKNAGPLEFYEAACGAVPIPKALIRTSGR